MSGPRSPRARAKSGGKWIPGGPSESPPRPQPLHRINRHETTSVRTHRLATPRRIPHRNPSMFTSGPLARGLGAVRLRQLRPRRTEPSTQQAPPPRWPWVVGVVAILAAIALVVSVSVLVTRTDTSNLATPAAPRPPSGPQPRCRTRSPTTTPPHSPPPPTSESAPSRHRPRRPVTSHPAAAAFPSGAHSLSPRRAPAPPPPPATI